MLFNTANICMFTNLFPPVVSGSSTQCSTLSRELVRRGNQVTVITARVAPESLEYEWVDGVHIYRLPSLRLPKLDIALNFPWLSYTFTPANLKRIQTILERHRPDVLHLHNHMFDLAFSAVVMHRRLKIPLVVTIHTMIKHAKSLYNLVLYPLDRLFLKNVVIKNADAVLCPDLNIVDYVHEAFQRPDAVLLPYGISETPKMNPELVEEIRQRYQLAGKRVILSLGHVHEIRNRKDLVEAMPAILKVFPNTVLLIVGVVATQTPVETARRLGIENSVIFAGHQPHAHIPALFELADLEAHWLTQDKPEKTSLGVATNNVAEWTGLLTGLEAALELGVDHLSVRLDSELVVKQISGHYRVKHEGLIPLHAKAKALLRQFAHVDVQHVRRKENAAADALVNQVLDAHR